jgi:NitT/TauT family transport system substrate-binding protein
MLLCTPLHAVICSVWIREGGDPVLFVLPLLGCDVMNKLVCAVLTTGILVLGTTNAETLRLGLGYIPDVQFTPFYVAEKAGFFAKRGLEVQFQHGFAAELYPLLLSDRLDFVVGDAEDVIALRAKDEKNAPLKYVMAMYQQVPNALFSKAEKGIKTVRDLKGKTIGMPGLFGVSYTSLQAMLRAAGLSERDVKIQQIGFTQAAAVAADRVDVAMGFVNNEPVQLAGQFKLNVIKAGGFNPSVGNGVMTTDAKLKTDGDAVRRFLEACQEAMTYTINNPKKAFEMAKSFVPTMTEDRMKVLEASIPLYQSAYSRQNGTGWSNPTSWQRTLDFLKSTKRVSTTLPATAFYTNAYLKPK